MSRTARWREGGRQGGRGIEKKKKKVYRGGRDREIGRGRENARACANDVIEMNVEPLANMTRSVFRNAWAPVPIDGCFASS